MGHGDGGLAARLRRTSDAVPFLDSARSFYFKGASTTELPATTEGGWRRRHSSQGHKAGPSATLHTYPCVGCLLRVPTHTVYGGPWASSSLFDSRAHAWTRARLEGSRDHTHGHSPNGTLVQPTTCRRKPQRGLFHKQPRDTCAARAPSRVTVGSRPENCIFWRYPPTQTLRLNLDFNTELRTIVPRPRR